MLLGDVGDHVWSTVVYMKWTNRTLIHIHFLFSLSITVTTLETMKTEYLTSFHFLFLIRLTIPISFTLYMYLMSILVAW